MTQDTKPEIAFTVEGLTERQVASGKPYHEFLRVPAMSAGLYILPAGSEDLQRPHNEDEMYYVVRGKGQFFYDGEDMPVQTGSVLYVPKHIEHRFHNIEEELALLVFFAPAET